MMRGRRAGKSTCRWAATRALDELGPRERAAYWKHLQDGCPTCGDDPRSFQDAAEQLGFSVTPVVPPRSLRERLLRRIDEMPASNRSDLRIEPMGNGRNKVLPGWARFWLGAGQPRLAWSSMAALVLVSLLAGWATLGLRHQSRELSAAGEEAYIDSLFARVAAVVRVGLGDHLHCAVFRRFPKHPPSDQKMAEKVGPKYAGLVNLVRERVPGEYRIFLGHRCSYRGRKFVHLALKSETKLLSVIITDKQQGESFAQGKVLPVGNVSGVPVYRAGVDEFEVAGFESEAHLVFVISDLEQDENLRFAAPLASPLRDFLVEREG